MCFLVLEHEKRPMKIRGEQVIAATIIPLYSDAVSAGLYIGAQWACAEVKQLGLLADAVPEARPAYAAMRAVGVTLSKSGAEAETDEVYVPLEKSQIVQGWHGDLSTSSNWPAELSDYWLPATFEVGQEQAEGWFRVKAKQDVEAILIAALADELNIVTIKPRYAVNLAICLTGIERADKRTIAKWAGQSFLAKQVVTA